MRNYLLEMLDALTSAYSRKDYDNVKRGSPVETNIGKLFSVLVWGLDQVKEQADLVKLWDDLDYAEGKVLDRYGANFGVKRLGATDRFYRLAIRVKLISQLSGGDIDTVLNAAASLFELDVTQVDLSENFPAKIGIDVNEADLSEEVLDAVVDIATMLKRIKAGGVGLTTTLRAYREYDGSTSIEGALFDSTGLKFDLPDVRRTEKSVVGIKTAVFDRSSLVFDLPEAKRQNASEAIYKSVLIEHTRIEIGSVC